MKNTYTATNAELDDVAIASNSQQGQRMLRSVYDFIGRFVSYPSEHAHVAHVLWIVHAHMMDRWDSTPRLAALSAEPASGKSRLLEVTELLVPSPVSSVNVSPAYLFRKVGSEDGVTILFDEIDTVFGPKAKENEEIRGLLNAGHRRGATAGRCVVKGKEIVTEELPAYAAVAMAGLGWLPDTLLSRSIIIRMRRRHRGERVEQFRRRIHCVDGGEVRALIEVWARSQPQEVEWPALPDVIQDRDADVWEPLIAVADAAGGAWPTRAREAAVALIADAKDVEPSLGIRLLVDLRTVFKSAHEMTTKDILKGLQEMEEAPWADLRGKPLDERGLARRLREYGVRSKNLVIGQARPKGYSREQLQDAWARYIPQSSDASATAATTATVVSFTTQPVAGVADVAELSGYRGGEYRCVHCNQYGETQLCSYSGADVWLHANCVDPWMADRATVTEDGIPAFLDRRGTA